MGCRSICGSSSQSSLRIKAAVWVRGRINNTSSVYAYIHLNHSCSLSTESLVRQMLAQRHTQRESIEGSSELLFHTHTQLFSSPLSTSAASYVWWAVVGA